MGAGMELFRYQGAQVRTVVIDFEPWFVAGDVCAVLDIGRVHDAVRGLDEDERGTDTIRTPGGDQRVSVINEAGLYSLILRSRKPEAKAFKRWITHEVLPTIRRTGGYQVQAQPAIPRTLSEALRLAADEHDRANLAEAKVAELEPVVAAVDVLTGNGDALKMGAVANMVGIGRNTLFDILRKEGVLQRDKRPYQRYAHWFRVVLGQHENLDGDQVGHHTTYVWPAGAASIHALLARRGYPVKPLPGVTALPAPRTAS